MNRRALITGARGKIGRALVAAFEGNGWQVMAANRGFTKNATQRGFAEENVQLDLTNDAQIESAAAQFFLASESGDHVALVTNASNREALGSDWSDLSRESFHALFDVDVVGHFLLARTFALRALEQGCTATILLLGSIYGSGGVHTSIYPAGMQPAPLHYSVVKAAVMGMAKDLAGRFGGSGITVNCLVPGGIAGGQSDFFVREFSALTQLGRMAESREVAAVGEMLCRPEAAYVTGQVIHVDGGWSAW